MTSKIVDNQERHDWIEYPIQDNVRLEVYWREDRGGRGPAASLYAFDDEILRLDCFGGDQGHCHVNMKQNRGQRWYYPEGTAQEHIRQAAFDLRMNTVFCLRSNNDEKVQKLKIEPEKLDVVSSEMERKMLEFANELGMVAHE
ncbi:hypothetical protein KFU94_68230 [Chloroflexi bacterium TSY]|nr:hypothetical protein [Chloroflexi bacterium TSY]